jgi:hypothetical protein
MPYGLQAVATQCGQLQAPRTDTTLQLCPPDWSSVMEKENSALESQTGGSGSTRAGPQIGVSFTPRAVLEAVAVPPGPLASTSQVTVPTVSITHADSFSAPEQHPDHERRS